MRIIKRAGLTLGCLLIVACGDISSAISAKWKMKPASSTAPITDSSLTFDPRSDSGLIIGILKGPITANTADALDDYISRNCASDCSKFSLNLQSNGGDVEAAMRMGRALRAIDASAAVSDISPCISSCVLVLAGASKRGAASIRGGKVLGIHSYYKLVESKSKEDALASYARVYSQVKDYLNEMRIPQAVLDLSYSVPPWSIRMLSVEEATDLHLAGIDPVFRDWNSSNEATRLGVPIKTYYERRARIDSECTVERIYGPNSEYLSTNIDLSLIGHCHNDILNGVK